MKGWIAARLPKGRFVRRLTLLASSTAIGQGVMVLVMPVLTRLYAPEEFGAYTVFMMIAAVIGIAAGLRYEAAIPLCRDDEDAVTVVSLVILISLLFALLAGLVLVLAGGPLVEILGFPDRLPLFAWLPLAIAFEGLILALNGWVLYRNELRILAYSKIALWLAIAFVQLVYGFVRGGAAGLVSGLLIGQLVSNLPILFHMDGSQRRMLLTPDFPRMRRLAWRYGRFPLFGSWAALLNSAAILLPAPLMAAVFGPAIAGFYGLAQRVMGLPIRFLGISASQVFTSEIARLSIDDRQALNMLFMSTVRHLAVLGVAYLGLVALLAPLLFAFVFGEEWQPSGELARILSLMYLAMFINYPIQYTLQFFERQDVLLSINVLGFLVVLACFAAAYYDVLGYLATMTTMSLGLAATNSACFFFALRLIRGSGQRQPPAGTAAGRQPAARSGQADGHPG